MTESWTRNEAFDKHGFLVVRDLWNPEELYNEVPAIRGQLNYFGDLSQFVHIEEEGQVSGSLARYWYPKYRDAHTGIRLKLEKIIGRKLYNTYYYDRFYFPGQELEKHRDRSACEISVSVHVSSNLDYYWPFKIESVDGVENEAELDPGDGLIYKGCEHTHWRDPLQSRHDGIFGALKRRADDTYYHQIFFHYVLADGMYAHCAWDRAR